MIFSGHVWKHSAPTNEERGKEHRPLSGGRKASERNEAAESVAV